ncbi:MAG: cupin domain-containing protein [Hyphomonadaceae bacterium]|nr:cupin domain-containing protein [Hyphomonadaceae bacterium]
MPDTIVQERSKIEDRIVRYAELEPCYDAFIDTRTPGSDKKENFTIIGPGVSENPNQHVHIAEPHGFNIGGARQPPRCTNSQHSHETVEVFYVHTGQWRFDLGENADDAQICLGPGDLISIPTNVFRGFTNIGESDGFLWAVLGGDDPGHVLWAPKVFDMARDYGLILLEDGMLIDINKGEKVPAGKAVMPVTTEAQVAALDVFGNAELEACVIRSGASVNFGPFNTLNGIRETALIGPKPIDWSHGFTLSELDIEPGTTLPAHSLSVADVYFVQSGKIIVTLDGEKTILTAGDTITFPIGATRSLTNANDVAARLVAVRGGDNIPEVEWT